MQYTNIYVIILNWNGKKDTLECLISLDAVSYEPGFHIILVDNGSTDDSIEVIRKAHPTLLIVDLEENLGFAGGNNKGIEMALSKGAEWIFLLNNDTIVSSDILKAFMHAAQGKPEAKILGAKIYRYDNPQIIDHLGGGWDFQKGDFTSFSQGEVEDHSSFETMQQVDYVCGAALLMHRSVPESIGLLEPRFFLLWEEADFCSRAIRHGFEIWTAPQAKIWHKISSSFIGGKPHMHYFWWRNRLLWIERNCSELERKCLSTKVIIPEILKTLRHFILEFLRFFCTRNLAYQQKALRNKAGLTGVIDYYLGRFGNGPSWLYTNHFKN